MPKTLTIHSKLTKLGRTLGVNSQHLKGYCNGFTLKWLEACLLGEDEVQHFLNRVKTLSAIESLALTQQIKQIKRKGGNGLSDAEIALLEIPAFMESIKLYQDPDHFNHLFGSDLHQQSYAEMSQLASSKGIEQLGGLTTIYSEPHVLNRKEIATLLDHLKSIIDANAPLNNKIGFVLGNVEHTIGLNYDLTTKDWTVMDINHWPPHTSKMTEAIAEKIMGAFNPEYVAPYLSFDTTIISAAQQQNPELNAQLCELRTKHLTTLSDGINSRLSTDSLMSIAALFGHHDFIKTLLEKAGSIEQKSYALTLAIQEGYAPITKALLEKGANPDFPKAPYGVTPLFLAILMKNIEITSMLLMHGANPDLPVENITPLYKAVEMGQLAIIERLTQYNANPNIANTDNGQTPLSVAIEHNRAEISEHLSKWVALYNSRSSLFSLPLALVDASANPQTVAEQIKIAMAISLDHDAITRLMDKIGPSFSAVTKTAAHRFFDKMEPDISRPAKQIRLTLPSTDLS